MIFIEVYLHGCVVSCSWVIHLRCIFAFLETILTWQLTIMLVSIPANSHALCASLAPADLKLWSNASNFSRLTGNGKSNCFFSKLFNNARDWREILWKLLACLVLKCVKNLSTPLVIFGSRREIFCNLQKSNDGQPRGSIWLHLGMTLCAT